MGEENDVLVALDGRGGRLASVGLQALTAGRALAQTLGGTLRAVILGSDDQALARDVAARGAAVVYTLPGDALADYDVELYATALQRAVETSRPRVLIVGQTQALRDAAARLAQRLRVGVVMNGTAVRVDPSSGALEVVAAIYGGDVRAVYRFDPARPQIVGAISGVAEAAEAAGPVGEVVALDLGTTGRTRRTRVVARATARGPRLEDADLVVSGGRGLGEAKNFGLIEELARVLGGMPAASRAIVDVGWADSSAQVGLTGKTVAPTLYLAAGVSGASQHMAGCSASRAIVAINRDADAPIFRYARYGVVADCLELLPILIEKCRQARAQPVGD